MAYEKTRKRPHLLREKTEGHTATVLQKTMRADICNGNDEASIQKFRETLRRLGAKIAEDGWAIGVTMYRVQIGREVLTVFSDTWSLDVEGPDELVQRVLTQYHGTSGAV